MFELCIVSVICYRDAVVHFCNLYRLFTDAEKMSLSHLAQKFFMLFLVAPVSIHIIT